MWAFILAMIFFAMIGGAVQALMPTFAMDAYGSKSFGINYGFILAAMSVGSVIGPQLAVRLSTLLFFGVGIAILLFTALALYTSRVAVNKEIGQKIF